MQRAINSRFYYDHKSDQCCPKFIKKSITIFFDVNSVHQCEVLNAGLLMGEMFRDFMSAFWIDLCSSCAN